MSEIETLITKANEVHARLKAEFDRIAICHCGDYCKDHGYTTGHAPSWNECPESRLISDAKHIVGALAAALAAERDRAIEAEAARWQEAIDNIVAREHPGRDGRGCDSPDPLDVTTGEIEQMVEAIKEKVAAFADEKGEPRKVVRVVEVGRHPSDAVDSIIDPLGPGDVVYITQAATSARDAAKEQR